VSFDDKNKRLIYEMGKCTLDELINYYNKNNIRWQKEDLFILAENLI
jgi:hypothetical protein